MKGIYQLLKTENVLHNVLWRQSWRYRGKQSWIGPYSCSHFAGL
jgi:hypothetical protein